MEARDPYVSLAGICTTAQWFSLPLDLRVRWWRETNYGEKPPQEDLLAALKAALEN